jgi:3-oxoacyl-[acyl-carrier protein] reductase
MFGTAREVMHLRFEHKVSIVTGAARGIGYEIASILAREGSTVVLADVAPDGLDAAIERLRSGSCGTRGACGCQGSGRRPCVESAVVNVGDVNAVRSMVEGVLARHGRIDVLVNNAGICPTTPVEEIGEAEWDKVLDVNLKGPFFLAQAVIPAMKAQRYGKIINIASIAGEMGALVAGCHYSVSKAGMLTLTKVLARRLAPWGVNVNSVAPGTIDSVMTADWSDEQRQMLTARIPLGRLGDPVDIANAVAFLASDESSFITGATIDVNGGALMR